MTAGSLTKGSGERSEIVCVPAPGIAKLIESGPGVAFASRIAWRRLPGPLSAALVTTNDAPCADCAPSSANRLVAATRTMPHQRISPDVPFPTTPPGPTAELAAYRPP